MPAIWLPYGSTSISVRIEPEDLAWFLPEKLNTNSESFIPELKTVLKEFKTDRSMIMVDPTLPSEVTDFLKKSFSTERLEELVHFDILSSGLNNRLALESACLISHPHLDPIIGFRGLGESLLPFFENIWEDFKKDFKTVEDESLNMKFYLSKICDNIDLKLIMLMPWSDGSRVTVAKNPIEAYESLEKLESRFLREVEPIEVLLVSAGGNPFDRSLSRASCILLNCLRNVECERIILSFEGKEGLGLDPDMIMGNNETPASLPPILKYIWLCKRLLKERNVYVVSAVPELLLNLVFDCKAYDTLFDAYKASRLFLPKGSRVGIVTHAPFISLRFRKMI